MKAARRLSLVALATLFTLGACAFANLATSALPIELALACTWITFGFAVLAALAIGHAVTL